MIDPALIPFIQRLDRDPDDDEALDAVHDAFAQRGDLGTFAVLAEKLAARQKDPARVAATLHRAAEAWASLAREDRAVPLWRQVLEADPAHVGANLGLAASWRRAGKLEQAEATYARLLDAVKSEARRIPILLDIAALRAERGDLDGEITAMREVVAHHGPGAAATEHRRTLARLLVQRSRAKARRDAGDDVTYDDDVKEAARTLAAIAREGATGRSQDFAQAALALWPGEETAFQMVQASTLKHADLVTLRIRFLAANPESAIATRVRGDLADAYVSTGRVDDAVAVLAAASEDPESARQLLRLYERTGRHKDLARLLAAMPTPDDRRERLVLMRRRAAVARTLGDRAGVVENLRRVLDDAPADPEALPEVERDLRVRGALDELRDRLRAAASDPSADAPSRVRWWREVAQLSERRFDDPEAALSAWRAALDAAEDEADRDEAREGIDRLLARLQRWDELADSRAVAARAAEGDEARREAWSRWLEVAEAHGTVEELVRGIEEALASAPSDALRAALVEVRRRAGDSVGLSTALRARAEATEGEEAATAWSELATHLETAGDAAGALLAWRKVRTHDPARAEAWRAEARIHEAAGDQDALLDTLTAHANHPKAAGRDAGALYGRAAKVAFGLGRDDEALRLAERALRFDADDAPMREMISALRVEDTAPVPIVRAPEPPPAPPAPEAPAPAETTGEVQAPEAHEATGVVEVPDMHDVHEGEEAEERPGESTVAMMAAVPAEDEASEDDGGPTGIMSRAALQKALDDAEREEAAARAEAIAAEDIELAEPTPVPPATPLPPPPRPSTPPPPPVTGTTLTGVKAPSVVPPPITGTTLSGIKAPSAPPPVVVAPAPPVIPPPAPPPVVVAPASVETPRAPEPSIIIDDGLLATTTAVPPVVLAPSVIPEAPAPPRVMSTPPPAMPAMPSVMPAPPPAMPAMPSVMPSVTPTPLQPLAMNPLPPPVAPLQPLTMNVAPLQPLTMHPVPAQELPSLAMRDPDDLPPSDDFGVQDPFADPFSSGTSDPFATVMQPAPAAIAAPAPPAPPAAPPYERVMLSMLERALGYRPT